MGAAATHLGVASLLSIKMVLTRFAGNKLTIAGDLNPLGERLICFHCFHEYFGCFLSLGGLFGCLFDDCGEALWALYYRIAYLVLVGDHLEEPL